VSDYNSTWSLQATLTQGVQDYFGRSMSFSDDGSYLAIGAYDDNNRGAVYVYTRSGTTWTQQQKITQVTTPTLNAAFGEFVSINGAGTTIIASAPQSTVSSATLAGRVYVYNRSGTTWSLGQTITQTGASTRYYFGTGVAISQDGNYFIVGAFGFGCTPSSPFGPYANRQGCVDIFQKSGSTYVYVKRLLGSGTSPSTRDSFGIGIGINNTGSQVFSRATNNTNIFFFTSANSWAETQKFDYSYWDSNVGGASGATTTNTAWKGDTSTLVLGVGQLGNNCIVMDNDTSFTVSQQLTVPDPPTTNFGDDATIARSADIIAVSSPQDSSGISRLYIYRLS